MAHERSFYALIEQFWFVGSRHSLYPVWHDSDSVLPTLNSSRILVRRRKRKKSKTRLHIANTIESDTY